MPPLTLYTYWRSSSAYRVRIALGLKGLRFESVAVNLLEGEQVAPEHKARNPMGRVPVLEVSGQAYSESVAIIELLEDLFPDPPLYPKDPRARARMRAFIEVINAGIQPLHNLAVLNRVSGDAAARVAWSHDFIQAGLASLEQMMGNDQGGASGPFAFGEQVSAADAFLVPQVFAARRFEVDLAQFPRVLRSEQAALALDAVRAASPERQ